MSGKVVKLKEIVEKEQIENKCILSEDALILIFCSFSKSTKLQIDMFELYFDLLEILEFYREKEHSSLLFEKSKAIFLKYDQIAVQEFELLTKHYHESYLEVMEKIKNL